MAIAVAGSAAPAHAQWTVTRLHPAGATESYASGVADGRVVGWAVIDGVVHAGSWRGSAETWEDLHPVGAGPGGSMANGVFGDAVVGVVNDHAGVWSGSGPSWVDLNPTGAMGSIAYGAEAGVQVGEAVFADAGGSAGLPHAGIWSGTAGSWVDLNPADATESHAMAVSGGRQVGWAKVFSGHAPHAGMWSGTAESWVDLNPVGFMFSLAHGIHGDQQVGEVWYGNVLKHAALWHSTREWVDLSPIVTGTLRFFDSSAVSVWNGRQVGSIFTSNGIFQASLWSGTAASWEDLWKVAPGSWGHTAATGVWNDASTVYVVGWGVNNDTGQREALLWTRPACRGDFNGSGAVSVQDIFDYLQAYFTNDQRADYTGDGRLDFVDTWYFLDAYFAACP